MLHFSRILCFLIVLCTFFSCARREQAFYQRSTQEHFSQRNRQQATVINSLPLDTNQALPATDIDNIEASTQTAPPASLTSFKWRKTPTDKSILEKTSANQPSTHKQKVQIRRAFLRKLVADMPVQTNGLAIASLVCGILSFIILGIVLGPLAIIFGGVALSQIRRNPDVKGRGMAVAGLILGIVGTIILLVVFAAR